jgi:hypothetical protein
MCLYRVANFLAQVKDGLRPDTLILFSRLVPLEDKETRPLLPSPNTSGSMAGISQKKNTGLWEMCHGMHFYSTKFDKLVKKR